MLLTSEEVDWREGGQININRQTISRSWQNLPLHTAINHKCIFANPYCVPIPCQSNAEQTEITGMPNLLKTEHLTTSCIATTKYLPSLYISIPPDNKWHSCTAYNTIRGEIGHKPTFLKCTKHKESHFPLTSIRVRYFPLYMLSYYWNTLWSLLSPGENIIKCPVRICSFQL
jgi:hypothetical protein